MRTRKSPRNRKAKIQNRNHKKTRYGMLGQGLTGVDVREVSRKGVTGESSRINAINSRSPVKVTRKGIGSGGISKNSSGLSEKSGVIKDSSSQVSRRFTLEDIRPQTKAPVNRPKLKPVAYLVRPQKTSSKHRQIIRKPKNNNSP